MVFVFIFMALSVGLALMSHVLVILPGVRRGMAVLGNIITTESRK